MEEFKAIIGYEGFYEISKKGVIRSLNRKCSNGNFYKGKNIKTFLDKDGYLICCIKKNGYGKTIKVHREVYSSFVGKIPTGLHVDHIDGNKVNNNIENLQVLTPRQNNEKKFRQKNGRCGYKKLNGKFQVRKSYGGVSYCLGLFDTENEAQEAYDIADEDFCKKHRKTKSSRLD